MTAPEIAVAGTEDVADVTRLLTRQLEEHALPLDARALSRAVSGLVHVPSRGRALVAREDGAAIGAAAVAFAWTVEHGGQVAWVDELYVVPERRGAGVGAALLERAIEVAKDAGAVAVELEVEESHARAESLYARAGFARLARRRWAKRL